MNEGPEILVIDDEGVVRDSCERTLAEEGFRVSVVRCGEEALPLLGGGRFSAVLLDLMMPGMGGMETLTRIRELRPDLPVVVITGYATLESEKECLANGAAAWLAKPFGPPDLLPALTRVLAGGSG